MYCNGYLFGNFRENETQQKIIHKYIKNSSKEINRNHISCIFNNMHKKLIKEKYAFFLKIANFNDNFIIIDDLN